MDEDREKYNLKESQSVLLEHIFRQMYAPLFFYALKFVESEEVAKDLVQDAFLNILKQKEKKIDNLKAFLYRSVRNNCLNYLEHLRVEREFKAAEIERSAREIQFYDTHQTLVEKEWHQDLKKAVDELPDKYRIPFKMSRFEELKNKEIAEKLQLPVRTVETQIYRAMVILREKFKNKVLTLFLGFFSKK
ncbi:RNA polymerase sigma-70 factor [Maribellus comscasis]|uniref:RNA polymerase sigma-70 factor n=1 Tax=Maribellus comscasis TaxID=2681766 RepID=A0A6I6KB40_9BACT|nr:RNA polymerase sigma-70 factor [Maribellus comscasis]QGY47424.1 RNA polymerase sigma-70 factor [Maribellus comscasis]